MPEPESAAAQVAALRARIAEIERAAAAAVGLPDAVAAHYSTTPPSTSRGDLRNAAHGFVPNDQMEQAIKARDRDPAAYAAAMAATHESGLPLSLYERGRAAALALNPDALKETK